jgi:hypothetical protein
LALFVLKHLVEGQISKLDTKSWATPPGALLRRRSVGRQRRKPRAAALIIRLAAPLSFGGLRSIEGGEGDG